VRTKGAQHMAKIKIKIRKLDKLETTKITVPERS
jgi:hypothetical protein